LLIFTSDRALMGELVNTPTGQTRWLADCILVVALNGWLLVGTALGV
jgi:manganese transport protein